MKKALVCLYLIVILFLPSCRWLYPNLMFQQKDYQYFELAHKQMDQYVIQPGDELSVRLFTRDGFRLIDVLGMSSVSTGNSGQSNNNQSANNTYSTNITYPVDNEGFARLPILGELFVKGYTEKELQKVLADRYANLFVDPFIIVNVTNRRCFVFMGSAGSIVTLNEAPTNLLEVIAKAGGMPDNIKAYKVKVIRGDLKNPQILLIDLSTLEGLRKADLIIQSNDIIYVEEKRTNVVTLILSEIAPYLGLITTVTTVILLVKTFGK
jgi:polysaccharide biosynthesis/export protein